ncbi:tyrosine-type recombinase/integrase [Dictyobacter alpinus]|uniref:tyrosine-type recombinase/integrase n=1 Tax=Dictyobacter alpinus TaxID=2014873 RepID=UPI000F81BAA0
MRFHDLRHPAATIVLAMSVDPNVVLQRLSHANVLITRGGYGHLTTSIRPEEKTLQIILF